MKTLAAAAVLLSMIACAKPEARVECKPAGQLLAHGFACSVAHVSGSGGEVCWSLNLSCANGTRGTAQSCAVVSRGETVGKSIAFADFGGKLDTCDAISLTTVSHASMTP